MLKPVGCTVTVETLPGVEGAGVGYAVHPIWAGVDRPDTGGWVLKTASLAERLRKAVVSGAAFKDAVVATDVNGKTYVNCTSRILGRHANADLKRLGY